MEQGPDSTGRCGSRAYWWRYHRPVYRRARVTKIRDRRGYATLLVLWLLVIASSVGLSAVLTGRDEYHFARNRFEAERAQWRAHGCASGGETSGAENLEAPPAKRERTPQWRHPDTLPSVPQAGRRPCVPVARAACCPLRIQ